MNKLAVSIVGASGYAGGEAMRILLFHPHVQVKQVTSERFAGKRVTKVHPNLRGCSELIFSRAEELESCDVLLVGLPHGESMERMNRLREKAGRVIDLGADFRLNRPDDYPIWYGREHSVPELLPEFVYGLPELHRDRIREATCVASPGCNATATILALYPLYRQGLIEGGRTVVEVKVGSSEGGNRSSDASHHPERSGCVRSFMPTGHRHTAEIIQELSCGEPVDIHFSATSIEMVRGVLATCHLFLKDNLPEKEIWKVYRKAYKSEPFVRIVKDRDGLYRYPEPKLLAGTNFCDVGFEKDEKSNRLVVISALDNLMKGAAGQAVQAMNLMCGFNENAGLEFVGLHP